MRNLRRLLFTLYDLTILFPNIFSFSTREMSSVELKNKYRKTFSIDEACQGWKAEYDMSRNLVSIGLFSCAFISHC